jgi:hypothetical protein
VLSLPTYESALDAILEPDSAHHVALAKVL